MLTPLWLIKTCLPTEPWPGVTLGVITAKPSLSAIYVGIEGYVYRSSVFRRLMNCFAIRAALLCPRQCALAEPKCFFQAIVTLLACLHAVALLHLGSRTFKDLAYTRGGLIILFSTSILWILLSVSESTVMASFAQ